MERKELYAKIKEMVDSEDFNKGLNKEIEQIVDSRQASLALAKEEPGTYAMAKVVLYAALKEFAEQYAPLSDDYRKEYRWLLHNHV